MRQIEIGKIENSIDRLKLKLQSLDPKQLRISNYNTEYLKKYLGNFQFYMSLYRQLLIKAIDKLNKPISESTFIDYGGGCGILSYLAKELGFKTIIYNDIYEQSIHDTQTISKAINLNIDHYCCGNIDVLVGDINRKNLQIDLICSFDVLEHIYDLNQWFREVAKIDSNFHLLFMTSANPKNPFITKRLKKLQYIAEIKGLKKSKGWKEMDYSGSFLDARANIIRSSFDNLSQDEIAALSNKTRGLRRDDIIKKVKNYLQEGDLNYFFSHPTNTCDPYTGNWTEKLIDTDGLKKTLESKHSLKVVYSNSYYSYSNNKLLNLPKYLLNVGIKLLGSKHLFLSPTYTLEVYKKNKPD